MTRYQSARPAGIFLIALLPWLASGCGAGTAGAILPFLDSDSSSGGVIVGQATIEGIGVEDDCGNGVTFITFTLIDENFDIRHSLCDLSIDHKRMVETARRAGASAKFAGSGGAIIGTYRDEKMYGRLKDDLEAIGCQVFKPLDVN